MGCDSNDREEKCFSVGFFFLILTQGCLLTFRDRGKEREREKRQCEKWTGCFPYAPPPGIEPRTFCQTRGPPTGGAGLCSSSSACSALHRALNSLSFDFLFGNKVLLFQNAYCSHFLNFLQKCTLYTAA